MIKSLHCFSCLGSFVDAAVNPHTGKVPARCLSSQILGMCYGPRGAEAHAQTPSCRCSADGWRAHSCGQSAQLRLYEQAVGRVRGVFGGRLTSSISWDGVFILLQKEKRNQVTENLYIPLLFGLAFTGVHGWALWLLLPFRLKAKTPMLVSFSHQYIFMQSTVAKDFSVPNWHGRVH